MLAVDPVDGECFPHQGEAVPGPEAEALVDLEPEDGPPRGDRVDERFFEGALRDRDFAARADEEDGAAFLRPGDLLGEAGQQVVDLDHLGCGQPLDVFFGHGLRGVPFRVDLLEVLSFGEDEDVEPEPLRRLADLIFEGRHARGRLGSEPT